MEEIISLIPTILIIVISVALAQKKKQNQASQRNQQTRKKAPVQQTPRGMRTSSQIMWEELQARASTEKAFSEPDAFTAPDAARDPDGGHHHHPDEAIYAGSLNAHTGEGEDACHDEILVRPERIQLEELSPLQEEPETTPVMNWNDRDDIVKGIIMQQVLERRQPRR